MKKEKDSAVNNGRLVGNKRMNNPENRDLRRETVLEVHTGSCVGSVIFIVVEAKQQKSEGIHDDIDQM